MTFEEKRAWVYGALAIISYTTYAVLLVGSADGRPLVEVPYVGLVLWTVGVSILAAIVVQVVMVAIWPRQADQRDERDREIERFGVRVGQSFVVIGAVAAMVMAMADWDTFWIANVIYLAFVLSAVLEIVARLAAYRWGFQ